MSKIINWKTGETIIEDPNLSLREFLTEKAVKEGVSLAYADLEGADLRCADLEGAIFTDADLREADLRGANLEGANLEGADLRGCQIWKSQIKFFSNEYFKITII